jgi:ankyrin repeat protein
MGYTPLMIACQHNQVAMVYYLVSMNASLSIVDKRGRNPLDWVKEAIHKFDLIKIIIFYHQLKAIHRGLPDLTCFFIANGLDSKKINEYNQTLLHLACHGGNLNIVQQLVEKNSIDTNIKDNSGMRAVDIAKMLNHRDIVEYLSRYEKYRLKSLFDLK